MRSTEQWLAGICVCARWCTGNDLELPLKPLARHITITAGCMEPPHGRKQQSTKYNLFYFDSTGLLSVLGRSALDRLCILFMSSGSYNRIYFRFVAAKNNNKWFCRNLLFHRTNRVFIHAFKLIGLGQIVSTPPSTAYKRLLIDSKNVIELIEMQRFRFGCEAN